MGPRGVWQRAMDWRWVMLIVAGLVVWVSHISAWAVLIVLVGGADFSRRLGEGWRRWWRAAVAPIPLFAPVIVMVLIPGTSSEISYGPFWWIYKKSTWERAMRDTNWMLDHVSIWAVGAVIGLAIVLTALSLCSSAGAAAGGSWTGAAGSTAVWAGRGCS
jgi:hypothetical protein